MRFAGETATEGVGNWKFLTEFYEALYGSFSGKKPRDFIVSVLNIRWIHRVFYRVFFCVPSTVVRGQFHVNGIFWETFWKCENDFLKKVDFSNESVHISNVYVTR